MEVWESQAFFVLLLLVHEGLEEELLRVEGRSQLKQGHIHFL